jgi:hypothetical protein
LDFSYADHTGEAETANGCRKPIGILRARTKAAGAIRTDQFKGANMFAEAASDMVIFTMHIISDSAADGDKTGAGCYG